LAALKDLAFMGTSTLVRLVFGLFTFAIMARLLGPNEFGVLMFWLSVATLLSLVANYGFTPYVLREIGADSSSANTVMGEVLSAKILVCGVIVVGSLLALPFIAEAPRAVFLLMTLAMLVDSITDFLNVGYRATNRFSSETRIATVASVSQFFIVAGAIWYRSQILIAASAFLVSRILVLLITWADQAQYFASLRPSPLPQAIGRLKAAFSYAYDFALQSLMGPLDSLVLNHYLGPLSVGIHQAGMRIFLGGIQIAGVLGGVYLPKLSSVRRESIEFSNEATKIQTIFILCGSIFGLTFAYGSELIVNMLYGNQYETLASLLPWFGFLFFVRFIVGSSGLLLTAIGKQSIRAKASLFHWTVIALAAFLLVAKNGNIGWLQSLISGNICLAILYISILGRQNLPSKSAVTVTVLTCILFFIKLK
jgi:O-antigen/teichoic acid export membrane protein